MRKWAWVAVMALLVVCVAGTQEKTSNLKFRVLKERTGKPIRNASVILHTVDKEGRQGKGGLQTKTDGEGRAMIPSIPYGKMRVQVIAHGMQTFGQDYEISQPEQEFVIKLKEPQEQYSIYK